MKFPFFKALLISGAMLAAWNCSDNAVPSLPNGIAIEETVKELNTGNETLYIADDNTVKNDKGEVVGSYDPTTGTVTDTSGNTVVENVSKDELDDTTISYPDPNAPVDGNTSDNGYGNGSGSNNGTVNGGSNTGSNSGSTGGSNTGSTGSNTAGGTTGGNTTGGNTGSTVGGNTGSGTQQGGSTGGTTSQNCGSDKCFDKRSNQCVGHYKELVGPNGEKYAYKNDCSIDCYWDGSNKNCSAVTSGSNTGSNNNQPTSSASQQQTNPPKSSASQQTNPPKSSASNGGSTGGTANFTPTGNESGNRVWLSRYWDGCKPSCGWTANSNPTAHSCSNGGTTRLSGFDDKSVLENGPASTCLDQSPRVIGNIAYAYAASHTNGDCGKCYLLEFDGGSNNTPNERSRALIGKKMVIMISNIGSDVGNNGKQFDVMIPGGGVGYYDLGQCIKSGKSPLYQPFLGSERYGGYLTDCGGAKGDGAPSTATIKSCITQKCNSISNSDAKAGCLFMANWYEAANNPTAKYTRIVCPTELTSRF